MKWLTKLFSSSPKPLSSSPATIADGNTTANQAASRTQPTIKIPNDAREYHRAYPSDIFPAFPLNPQNLFYKGGAIKDQYLLNAATVGLCICDEIDTWRNDVGPHKWPSYADNELAALKRAFEKMHARVAFEIRPSVKSDEVKRLAKTYISKLKASEKDYVEFMAARFTLYNLTVDFGNTIACGATLQTSLEWFR